MPTLYGTITAALIVAVAAIAFVVRPADPPSVAEFAPDAKQVDEARNDQGAPKPNAECRGSGCANNAGAFTSPTTVVGKDGKLRRRCYGDPPRQTPDPLSPPCVPEIFRGTNAGATSKGVTSTEVKIAVLVLSNGGDSAMDTTKWNEVFEHFNRYYETWGRHLSPVYVSYESSEAVVSPDALAARVAATGAFAAVQDWIGDWFMPYLADRQIIAVALAAGVNSRVTEEFASRDPYLWSLRPPLDKYGEVSGALTCASLRGHNATHAGNALRNQSRVFGVLAMQEEEAGNRTHWDKGPLLHALGRCGISPALADYESLDNDAPGQAVAKFRSRGVTTVLFVGEGDSRFVQQANQQGYEPEYFFTDGTLDDMAGRLDYGGMPQNRTFGVSSDPALVSDEATYAGAFVKSIEGVLEGYQTLRLVASGIQLAGSALTPRTFGHALQQAVFPIPSPGSPPEFPPHAGFAGDHAFFDDFLAWFGDTTYRKNANMPAFAALCYAGGARRFNPTTVPSDLDNQLFNRGARCRPF